MFDLIRERKKLLLALLLLLVIPPFVVVGAWDRINPGMGVIVASVNGKDIYKREWEIAHAQLIEQFKQRLGQDIPEDILNSQSAKEVTLDDMISREILKFVTQNMNIAVSNDDVKNIISSIPQFQTEGKFDLQKAQKFLKQSGTKTEVFEASIRNDLAMRVIPSGISETVFIPRTVARKIAQAENEQRSIKVKFFSSLSFDKQVSINDDEVENFYDQNKKLFQIPASYDIEFLLVKDSDSLDEIANSIYEESDSLVPTADSFSLTIKKINNISINQPYVGEKISSDELYALNSPIFRKALKNQEVLEENINTDLIEITPNLHISARVIKKNPEKPIELSTVKPQIESDLKLKKMSEMANASAKNWVDEFNDADNTLKGKLLSTLSKSMLVNRKDPDSGLGDYKVALSTKIDEIFNYNFNIDEVKKIDLAENGAIVVYFQSSFLPKVSAPEVKASLPEIYNNMNNSESNLSFKNWLISTQTDMDVVRYPKRLISSSTSDE